MNDLNLIKASGTLIYQPYRPGIRKFRNAHDWMAVVETGYGISDYYRWWFHKKYGVSLLRPAWKPHITVLNGKEKVQEQFSDLWGKYNNKRIEFLYNPKFEQHWKFFVLPVYCPQLISIRRELGFTDKIHLHLTFGRME